MGDVSHQSQANQNRCGSASALDKTFTPVDFQRPTESELPVTSLPPDSYFPLL